MKIKGTSILSIGLVCAAVGSMPTALASASGTDIAAKAGQPAPISASQAISNFQSLHLGTAISSREDGSIGRVYGKAFSHGQTGAISASRFLAANLSMWGVPADELVAEGPFDDGHHTQLIGYEPLYDTYKFTGHYYKQIVEGIPVFRSKLVLLTRNETNNPLVLASSDLRNLNGFKPNTQLSRTTINHNQIVQKAEQHFNLGIILESSERTIYAGVETAPHAPTLAEVSTVIVNGFEKHIVVTDTATGDVLFSESIIHTLDISGNVSGMSSEGLGADICENEVSRPLPYLFVNGPSGSTQTDSNGNYTLSNPGLTPVNIDATLTGEWFQVFDFLGSVESLSDSVTPPGPGNLLFNASNSSQNIRAQVNAYVEANIVRDFTIAANPAYPGTQFQMDVTVNRTDGFCPGNAWYDPADQSINFCLAGGSNPNTAWSSVIHHEYGHHLVNVGGSDQGQYGEGMGDVVSTIILDDPRLGLGFFGSCGSSLRNADNNHQYPCVGGIHDCGQLISGCVWDTRQAMVANGVSDYSDVLRFLAVNAILVHSGDTITPQITIDWLTLDDDDSDIGNGTPHYNEIAQGFGLHNMDAPALNALSISFPSGQPDFIDPNGGTSMTVSIQPVSGSLDQASPTLMVDIGSGFAPVPMNQISASQYEVQFPSSTCGSQVEYYITADTTSGATQTAPTDAPSQGAFATTSSFSPPTLAFDDNFQTNLGWTVSGGPSNAGVGRWERATPTGAGQRGDPANDSDGSGICYITGNGGPGDNTDVDDGTTTLTSPVMDASGDAVVLSYARWYDNSFGAAPMADTMTVEVSDDAGSSWVNLETVGPTGPEVSGGWVTRQFPVDQIAGINANNQFRIRFNASDLGSGSVVEAGVDAVMLSVFDCIDDACAPDLTGDGNLNFSDVSAFLDLFAAADSAADLTGDGNLNFSDVSAFLDLFALGCP